MSLTFVALRAANIARLPQFKNKHGAIAHAKADGSDWSPAQWLQAVVGELGEYANVRKKYERGDLSADEFNALAADELADVQTYLDILALQLGVDLGRATADKFNRVSERVGCNVRLPDAAPKPSAATPLQSRVKPWMDACFGPAISADRVERNHRFIEESLELVQSLGCTASEAHQLVDYVYGRPLGDARQEVGGVMITLAALCLANDMDMHDSGEVELARVWTKVDVIRAKQAAKPPHSPLPEGAGGSAGDPMVRLPSPELLAMAQRIVDRGPDTRTEEQLLADGVAFVMGPGGDEGTRQRAAPADDPHSDLVRRAREAASMMGPNSAFLSELADAIAARDRTIAELVARLGHVKESKRLALSRAAAAEGDAERYRWLRDEGDLQVRDVFGGLNPHINDGLDVAVDAAIAAGEGKTT